MKLRKPEHERSSPSQSRFSYVTDPSHLEAVSSLIAKQCFLQSRKIRSLPVSLSGDNEAELKAYFEKLSAGGIVTMPLEKAPWGDLFGMCTDKFGVQWMVNIASPKE